jgi:hypothetical protein
LVQFSGLVDEMAILRQIAIFTPRGSISHSVQVLADSPITAPQFAQRPQSVFPVIDRPQHPRAQQVGQLARIYLVALVAFLL